MLDMFLSSWWMLVVGMLVVGVAAWFALRFWCKQKTSLMAREILRETQAGFAHGNSEVHSIKAVRTLKVQDETAILYHIDATISPSHERVKWCGSDLFLRGTDRDPNQVGDVLSVKLWNGTSFEAIKNRTELVGTQRLLLSMRFAGSPGQVRFNFNFANFGEIIRLPEIEIAV